MHYVFVELIEWCDLLYTNKMNKSVLNRISKPTSLCSKSRKETPEQQRQGCLGCN